MYHGPTTISFLLAQQHFSNDDSPAKDVSPSMQSYDEVKCLHIMKNDQNSDKVQENNTEQSSPSYSFLFLWITNFSVFRKNEHNYIDFDSINSNNT